MRYRTVYCRVWNDDKFPFVSDDLQLVWFHIHTTPFSTPIGLFKCPLAALAAEKHWPIERYRKAFREGFAKGSWKGFWKHDEKNQVIWIRNYFRYNKPGNPNVLTSWVKLLSEIPDCGLKDECFCSLVDAAMRWGGAFEAFAKGLGKAFESTPVPVPVPVPLGKEGCGEGNHPAIDGHEGKSELIAEAEGSVEFEQFWVKYPRKIDKDQARLEYLRARADPDWPGFAAVMGGLEAWISSDEWEEQAYIPYPVKWLKMKRWNCTPKPGKRRETVMDKLQRIEIQTGGGDGRRKA